MVFNNSESTQPRHSLTLNWLGLGAGMMLLTTTACSEPEVPETPVPDGGYTAPEPTPEVDAGPPPVTDTSTPCDHVMQVALQTAIQGRAKTELGFGMKAEGGFACQQVTQGGSARVPVTLQPGACYTFLAHSFPNVTEVDVFLKPNLGPTPPPLLASFANVVFAQDSETGASASIGAGKNCFKNPMPLPGAGIVEAVARTGDGPIAVQVYSRQ